MTKRIGLSQWTTARLPVILNDKDIKSRYYIRSGNRFDVASHTMLEDMFGRRPKPELTLRIKLVRLGKSSTKKGLSHYVRILLAIENTGRGSAKAPFLSVKTHAPHKIHDGGIDGNMHFGLCRLNRATGQVEHQYGASQDLIIDYALAAEGYRLTEGQKIVTAKEIVAVIPDA